VCTSLAILAGRVRYMSDTGRVGFHAAYTDQNGQVNISSAGNAVVGAYLNQLGLPTSAIVYITESTPSGMQWLKFADAPRFGIDVKRFNISGDGPPKGDTAQQPKEVRPSTSAPLDESIIEETRTFISATNLPNEKSLSYLQSKYSNDVSYFGKVVPKKYRIS
jgi:hypothetical protein